MSRALRRMRSAVGVVTPLGWVVVALSVATWLVAALLDWHEMAITAATCGAVVVMSALLTLGGLDLTSHLELDPRRVVAGERAAGAMVLTNSSRRTSRSVIVELPVGSASRAFRVPRLAAGDRVDELFVVPTQRRAVIPVGPVTTIQGDPWGVMRRRRSWSEVHEIFVHPRTTPLTTIAVGLRRDLEGHTTNHLSNSDIAFHTLREYVPGDDRRHVHWKSSAKAGTLLIRQYVDTRRSHVCVLVSTASEDYENDDDFELAVSAAASVIRQTRADSQTVTVIIGGVEWPESTTTAYLDRMCRVEMTPGRGSLQACFVAARSAAGDASVLVVVSGSRAPVSDFGRSAHLRSPNAQIMGVRCGGAGHRSRSHIGDTTVMSVTDLESLRRAFTVWG